MRDALATGRKVVIFGWKQSNHSPFTQELSDEKVRLFERLPDTLPQNVGVVIGTRFIRHAEMDRVRKQHSGDLFTLPMGEIKRILVACADVLAPAPKAPRVREVPMVTAAPAAPLPAPAPVQMPVTLKAEPSEEEKMDTDHVFAKAFMEAVESGPHRSLSRNVVAKLRKNIFGDQKSIEQLVRDKWLEPIKSEKRVSSYKAGAHMLEIITSKEPADPIEGARWLISSKTDLEKKKADLEQELESTIRRLEQVKQAEELLRKLEELMKPE